MEKRFRHRLKGQLNDPQVKRSHCCGSARELPGGGWLVSWGDNKLVTGFDREGRIAAPAGPDLPCRPGAAGCDHQSESWLGD